MSNTLLPCPFCGGEAIFVKTERCGRYVGCWDCGGRTEEVETDYAGSARDKAIAAWNRRADAVPVVRGEWVEAKSGVMSVYPPGQVMCSVCKQRMPSQWKKMPPYCYGCGAKMEGKPCG